MPYSEPEQPIPSEDGRWVFFLDSLREQREHALWLSAVSVLVSVVALVSTYMFGSSDRDRPDQFDHVVWVVVGVIGAPLLTVGLPAWLVYLWKRLHAPRIRLAMSADGIYLPSRAESVIPWAAIARIVLVAHHRRGNRIDVRLCLHVRQRGAFGYRGSPLMRGLEQWQYGTDVTLRLEALIGTPDDVLAALRQSAPPNLTAGLDIPT